MTADYNTLWITKILGQLINYVHFLLFAMSMKLIDKLAPVCCVNSKVWKFAQPVYITEFDKDWLSLDIKSAIDRLFPHVRVFFPV